MEKNKIDYQIGDSLVHLSIQGPEFNYSGLFSESKITRTRDSVVIIEDPLKNEIMVYRKSLYQPNSSLLIAPNNYMFIWCKIPDLEDAMNFLQDSWQNYLNQQMNCLQVSLNYLSAAQTQKNFLFDNTYDVLVSNKKMLNNSTFNEVWLFINNEKVDPSNFTVFYHNSEVVCPFFSPF